MMLLVSISKIMEQLSGKYLLKTGKTFESASVAFPTDHSENIKHTLGMLYFVINKIFIYSITMIIQDKV